MKIIEKLFQTLMLLALALPFYAQESDDDEGIEVVITTATKTEKDILDTSHWSEGLEDYIDVGDMDMYHLLRTFNILLRDREKLTKVMKALEIENE